VKLMRNLFSIRKLLTKYSLALMSALFVPVLYFAALLARFISLSSQPRLVWGSTPIINNSYWSRAMRSKGFHSETFTFDFYKSINQRSDWDRILSEEYKWCPVAIKPYIAFICSMFRYDVYVVSCDGFFIGATPLKSFQAGFLKLANKKIVVLPYGGDAYVYGRLRSTSLMHGLLMSYPQSAKRQHAIAHAVDYWTERADVLIPGFMGADGFGRWDVLVPSPLALDLGTWKPKSQYSRFDGSNGVVVIAHAPNHRGFKGTEFVIRAIETLKESGLKVELRLLEKMQNAEVRRVLREEVDILVEQLVFVGHGLNGLEGMATGLPTISNLEHEDYIRPMRRWSFFSECPLVSATPETLTEVLKVLVTRPELRRQIGMAGRQYTEKYHGLDSAQFLFMNVIEYLYGKRDSLINLYHPLLGEYPNRSPKIVHPLINNQVAN